MIEIIYNIALFGYVAYAMYVLTEPWHDQMKGYVYDAIGLVVNNWRTGKFYLEATIETELITKGM